MKKVDTESGRFNDYGGLYEIPEGQTPIIEILKEILGNFEGSHILLCPFFSLMGNCCGFTVFAELIGEHPDRKYAKEVEDLFLKLIPKKLGRRIIQMCGTELSCSGLKKRGDRW